MQSAIRKNRPSLRGAFVGADTRDANRYTIGTRYLHALDSVVREMSQYADDYLHITAASDITQIQEYRYTTPEEIYHKLFKPACREFQQKQRS